jgi:hypothetical protein
MAKFRTKTVEIEAVQFHAFPESGGWPKSVQTELGVGPFVVSSQGRRSHVDTGDWIITEPNGRGYFACPADAFAAMFEPAE